MISMVVCSKQPPDWTLHQRNVAKTAADSIEYLRIDNRDPRQGICSVYNRGIAQARGDIVVFMHEDAFFMEKGWDTVLEKKFNDPSIGLLGVAGTQYLFAGHPGWVAAGRPFIRGKVIHETNNGEIFHLTVFSWDDTDSEVVATDGLFFAVRKSLFNHIGFDEAAFDGFHFYDLDICMQVRKTHRLIVTPDIIIKHQSGGSFDALWQRYAQRFRDKYRHALPAACIDTVPDLSKRVPFENFDLKGKVPQVTIS
jgi:glycosyltransferase involved in cell wall biosynthesis